MIIKNISEVEAKEISLWKYLGEYSVYNYPSWETMCKQNWAITIDNVRAIEYFGLYNTLNILIGNFRLHNTGEFILVSLALNPSLCGKGLGNELMNAIKNQSKIKYPDITKIVLEVRSFNRRAIKCYQKNGFKIENIYIKDTLTGKDIFFKMVYYSA